MQSFLHGALLHDSGYFHVWISSVEGTLFFSRSEDKALFMTLLHDSLSPRAKLDGIHLKTNGYSTDIDLLAYSLTQTGVHLLVHTKRKTAIEELGQALLFSYQTYLQQQAQTSKIPFDTIFIFDKLAGRHEALHVSKEIHLLHDEWRYDRYSSIGFYLDDRRGDWMRPYRLTSLFNAQPKYYLQFMRSQDTESDRVFEYIET
jgi:hypothetical protein